VIDLNILTLQSRIIPEEEQTVSTGPGDGVVHVAPGVRLGVLYTELAKSAVTSRRVSVRLGFLAGSGPLPESRGGFSTRALLARVAIQLGGMRSDACAHGRPAVSWWPCIE